MSLPNTFDSTGTDLSGIGSQSSQPEQIFVTTTTVKNQHLTLAQMRGVIQIFKHYFPKKPGKRMTRDEKNRRWTSYKNKVYRDYRRIITGKFSSEKALVKRYSEPLSFIKYKLKRARNLKLSDLSETDREYYFEIGGLEDINELIKKTYDIDGNIDSLENMSNNFEHYNNRRKRRRIEMESNDEFEFNRPPNVNTNNSNSNSNNNNSNNHNINSNPTDATDEMTIDDSQATSMINSPRINNIQMQPIINSPQVNPIISRSRSRRNNNNKKKMTQALSYLNDKLDMFEREQLDKKKIEIFEITKQKILATKQSVETLFMNSPHLIGCLPGITDQNNLAFDCWLSKYKDSIISDPVMNGYMDVFIEQLVSLKSSEDEYDNFLARWK